jgi:AraC-like DNA-binding protein
MAAVEHLLSLADLSAQPQAGTIVYPPGGTFGPRVQLDYQLVYLHRGCVDVEIDGAWLHLGPGEVALLTPGHREFFRFARTEETHHSWVALRHLPLAPEQIAELDAAPRSLPLSAAMSSILEACLAVRGLSLLEPRRRPAAPAPPELVPLVVAALVRYGEEAHAPGSPGQGEPDPPHPALARALWVIHHRLDEPLTLRDLAAAAHVTPEYLVRLFRRRLGTSPLRYLWQERVRFGLSLLEHTGLPVGEIAARAGFQTVYHFSRRVRAATGVPPTRLRRRRWLGTPEEPADSR